MAVNTVKAIRERLVVKAQEMRDLHTAIGAETDTVKREKLELSFDAADAGHQSLQSELQRAERMEDLEASASSDLPGGLPGDETEERDSPLLDPDKHGYSLLRAIGRRADGMELNGVEGEIHQELAKRAAASGKAPSGFMVPHTLRMIPAGSERRAVMGLTQGAGAIPDILSPNLIDALRNMMVLSGLGAITLSNMVGTFAIPKKTAVNTFEWVGESTAATGSRNTVGQVTFGEKTVSGWTALSRSMLKQASLDMEAMARQDLAEGLAVALDAGGLANASGGAGPTGLLYLAGIDTIAMGANGAAPSHAKFVEMETNVFVDNANVDNMAYVVNAQTRGKCKTTLKASGIAGYLWETGNTINGYNAPVTNAMPRTLVKAESGAVCSAALFGNFRDAIFALWGGVDLVVDPYTEAKKGDVILVIHQSADFNVRRTESFTRCLDLLST